MRLLLLPGLDGGAGLLRDFQDALPPDMESEVFSYSDESDYEALEAQVREQLGRSAQPVAIVAESFSGPVAIRLAASPPINLMCVVLVATFDRAPAPRALSRLVVAAMFRRPPPAFVVRRWMLSPDATDDAVARVQDAVGRVKAELAASRIRAVLAVDVSAQAASIQLPVLYLKPSEDRLVRRPLQVPASPNWEVDTIEGPHLVLQHTPVDCAQRIARFVRANQARRGR